MSVVEVILPKWGLTMEEGTLVEWDVNEGDQVTEGQVIAHIETDKVLSDLEAPASGVVKSLKYSAGTDGIPVGAVLCEIEAG